MNLKKISAERYKEIFFISDDDILALEAAGKQIYDDKDEALDEYYAWMSYHPDLQEVFNDSIIAVFEEFEDGIWADLVLAKVNDDFVERFQQLSKKLYFIELPFEAYLSALFALHEIIENIFARHDLGSFELLRSFKKIAGISLFVAIDTYNDIINDTIKEQNNALMQMSTPVTQLWNGILFLPLVGIIDSKRAQDVMTAMLNKISESQAKVFILDISGIGVLDTAVANYLIKITKATRLMGCLCIISGISGAVAQTIVELGIQIDEVETTGSMQDAVDKAFRLTGAEVVQLSNSK